MSMMDNLFLSILQMSITAGYTAAAVMVSRQLLKKAPKLFSYILWLPVLLRLLCPFRFSGAFSFLGLLPGETGTPWLTGMTRLPAGGDAAAGIRTGLPAVDQGIQGSLPAAAPLASADPLQIWIALGTLLWLTGLCLMILYALVSYLRLTNRIRTATRVCGNVYETDRVASPFVCGFLHPKIYLPLAMIGLERDCILRHEAIHIRRYDHIVKPLAFLALSIHWFNPLIWLSFSLMTKDMEMSCDEQVLRETGYQKAADYSRSLLAMASANRWPRPVPLAFGESNVSSRIKNILGCKKPAFWVFMVSILAVLLLTAALLTDPVTNTEPLAKPAAAATSAYDTAALLERKTPYVGNNSKVMALVDHLPLPRGINRTTLQLSTQSEPYGLTVHYKLADDDLLFDEGQFAQNSMLLFAMIDNVSEITHIGSWNNMLLSSMPFVYTYTRADAEKLVGGDLRLYAENDESMNRLIAKLQGLFPEASAPSGETAGLSAEYAVIPGIQYHVLVKESFELEDPANPQACVLIREYLCFDDTGASAQEYPALEKTYMDLSADIQNAADFKNLLNQYPDRGKHLALRTNTIVSQAVAGQWSAEGYETVFEYSEASPSGLTYESLQKLTW